MRLRQIEVFHAVYTCGTMTSAARLLNVSQPSVSKVLAHAEQQLGYPLFERVRGKLVPRDALAAAPFVGLGAALGVEARQGVQQLVDDVIEWPRPTMLKVAPENSSPAFRERGLRTHNAEKCFFGPVRRSYERPGDDLETTGNFVCEDGTILSPGWVAVTEAPVSMPPST